MRNDGGQHEMTAGAVQIAVPDLVSRLESATPPLLLDIRREAAFIARPEGLPGAIALRLDQTPVQIPDLPREQPMVIYCVCDGQASSTRAAEWLLRAGYRDVNVLTGGLEAWRSAGLELAPVALTPVPGLRWQPAMLSERHQPLAIRAWASEGELPFKRDIAVAFVDMVGSTQLVDTCDAREVLARLQRFMHCVVEVAAEHCGDVHDFAGDGALLYFADAGDALEAVLGILRRLADERESDPRMPAARVAMAAGPVVVGQIGGMERQSLAFVGASINLAARMLAHAPVNGIAASQEFLARLSPRLATPKEQFTALPEPVSLRGFAERQSLALLEIERVPGKP